jgi:hypothetical protein
MLLALKFVCCRMATTVAAESVVAAQRGGDEDLGSRLYTYLGIDAE